MIIFIVVTYLINVLFKTTTNYLLWNMSNQTVQVKVHPTIKEFIVTTTGSDTIVPKKDDWLWFILKQNLEVPPSDYTFLNEEKESFINISLLDTTGTKVQVRNQSKRISSIKDRDPSNIYLNPLFRWYLSDKAQNMIATHFRKAFKECFHNYVQGALVNNPKLEQKEAIMSFCDLYKLEFNAISEDMLIKSWQRSPQKSKLKELIIGYCPLLF